MAQGHAVLVPRSEPKNKIENKVFLFKYSYIKVILQIIPEKGGSIRWESSKTTDGEAAKENLDSTFDVALSKTVQHSTISAHKHTQTHMMMTSLMKGSFKKDTLPGIQRVIRLDSRLDHIDVNDSSPHYHTCSFRKYHKYRNTRNAFMNKSKTSKTWETSGQHCFWSFGHLIFFQLSGKYFVHDHVDAKSVDIPARE